MFSSTAKNMNVPCWWKAGQDMYFWFHLHTWRNIHSAETAVRNIFSWRCQEADWLWKVASLLTGRVGGEGPDSQEPLRLRDSVIVRKVPVAHTAQAFSSSWTGTGGGEPSLHWGLSLCDQVYFWPSSRLTALLGTKRDQCWVTATFTPCTDSLIFFKMIFVCMGI